MPAATPDRREFLGTAAPFVVGVVAGTAAPPPPVPAKRPKPADLMKTLTGAEALPLPAGASVRLGSPRMRMDDIRRIQFAPKGSTLVAVNTLELRAWDVTTGKIRFRLGFPENRSIETGRLTNRDTFALLVRSSSGPNRYEFRHYSFAQGNWWSPRRVLS